VERNEPQRRREHRGEEEKKGNLRVIYGSGQEKSLKAAEQLEINYKVQKKPPINTDES
jgi:hypothetical protein